MFSTRGRQRTKSQPGSLTRQTHICLPVGMDPLLAGVGILCRLLHLWRNTWNNQYSVTPCLDEEFSPCISHDRLPMDHLCKHGNPTKYHHDNQLQWLGWISHSQMSSWDMQMNEVETFHLTTSRGQRCSSKMTQWIPETWKCRLNVA